jgi:hypothetical protein
VCLSRVCAETPVKLRLCRAGEQGSVISNYTSLGEDHASQATKPSGEILARTEQVLKSPKHGRETMLEFRQDCAPRICSREELHVDCAGKSGRRKLAGCERVQEWQ